MLHMDCKGIKKKKALSNKEKLIFLNIPTSTQMPFLTSGTNLVTLIFFHHIWQRIKKVGSEIGKSQF